MTEDSTASWAGTKLTDLLELARPPVAVQFASSAPEGVRRIDQPAVSGCTYWKLAAEGNTFFTEAVDHFGCPVGSHTHGIDLPDEQAAELEGLVGTMVQLEYLSMDEVPQIPQVEGPFGVAVYAPLAEAGFEPDVILVTGTARQLMLLAEAAHAAGIPANTSVVGRPTCAAIPAVMQGGGTAANLGCIGNRVYTDLADDQLYFVFSGEHLPSVVDKLGTVVNANNQLESFHRGRLA